MRRTGIYCFENTRNGKRYIGQAVDMDRRWYEHAYHLERGTDKCVALQRAVTKYGIESFRMYVLEYCNQESLNEQETYWIGHYNSNNKKYGYNLSSGGDSGLLGFKHSEESKKRMSQGKKGWVMSDKQREFISKLHKGKHVSKETREKMSAANTKERHPMWGKKHSPETIQKYKEIRSGTNAHQFGTKSSKSSSKYFGVCRLLSKGYVYWTAYVKVNGQKHHLGSSKSEEDAARRYDQFIVENNLPNPLNFPEEWR